MGKCITSLLDLMRPFLFWLLISSLLGHAGPSARENCLFIYYTCIY